MKLPKETCRVSATAARDVTGRVAYSGAAWVRPDYRGRSLALVLPRIAKAYAFTRWRPDFIVSWMTEATYQRGLIDHVGYTTVDWDVQLRNSFTGDLKFAFLSMRQRCLLDYVRDFSTSMAQVDRGIGQRRAQEPQLAGGVSYGQHEPPIAAAQRSILGPANLGIDNLQRGRELLQRLTVSERARDAEWVIVQVPRPVDLEHPQGSASPIRGCPHRNRGRRRRGDRDRARRARSARQNVRMRDP